MTQEARKRYKKKTKTRLIDFYIKDQDIYEFSKTINFQKEVKKWLATELAKKNSKN